MFSDPCFAFVAFLDKAPAFGSLIFAYLKVTIAVTDCVRMILCTIFEGSASLLNIIIEVSTHCLGVVKVPAAGQGAGGVAESEQEDTKGGFHPAESVEMLGTVRADARVIYSLMFHKCGIFLYHR